MSEGKVLVCNLPENERNDLISLFQQCKLTGQIMTMTKEDAEKLINEAMNGKENAPETKEENNVSESVNKQNNTAAPTPKPQKNLVKQDVENLPRCPRCYSPVKGKKCSFCGLKL